MLANTPTPLSSTNLKSSLNVVHVESSYLDSVQLWTLNINAGGMSLFSTQQMFDVRIREIVLKTPIYQDLIIYISNVWDLRIQYVYYRVMV